MIEIILTLGVVFLAGFLFFTYKSRSPLGPPLPGPKGYPIVGNLFEVNLNRLYLNLFEWSKQYGEIFQFNLFGRKMVSLNSSEIIRELFAKEPYSSLTTARPPTFAGKYFSNYEDVFLASSSEKIVLRRKYLHKVMHTYGDGLKYLAGQITYLLSDLVDDIDKFKGKTCNPVPLIDRFVLGSLQILLIGKLPDRRQEFHRYLKDIDDSINAVINPGNDTLFSVFPFLRYTPLAGAKAYRLYRKRRAGLLDLLDSLTKGDEENQGIYQQMMKVINSGEYSEWFNELIMLELITFNVVGATYLTTRNALTAIVRLLLSSPEVQKKLQAEVDTVIGRDRKPNISDRYNMPYMEAVILEALRYVTHFALSGFHQTTDDITIRGYHLPKGTTFIPNLWTIHHSEKEWKDPFNFNPDRFLDEDGNIVPADHPIRKQFLIFGIGKRSCIGEVFAKTRIFLFTSILMQFYTIESEDGVAPPMLNVYDMIPGVVLQVPEFQCKFTKRY